MQIPAQRDTLARRDPRGHGLRRHDPRAGGPARGHASPSTTSGRATRTPLSMHRIIEIWGSTSASTTSARARATPGSNFVQAHWEPTPVSKEGFFSHGAPAIARRRRPSRSSPARRPWAPRRCSARPPARSTRTASWRSATARSSPSSCPSWPRPSTSSSPTTCAPSWPPQRDRPRALNWAPERHRLAPLPARGPPTRASTAGCSPRSTRSSTAPRSRCAPTSRSSTARRGAERHEHRAALLRMEGDGLARVSFREWKAAPRPPPRASSPRA
jgi:hypothetical protein